LASRKSEYKPSAGRQSVPDLIPTLAVVNAISYPPNLKKDPVALLLFDLDDTLLGNEMNIFVPAYLQALAKRMSDVAEPTELINTLLNATRKMVDNQDPSKTLEQVFDAEFYPALGLLRQQVQESIDTFYKQDFPRLKALTQIKPQAVDVVQSLVKRGDQTAVATNPLFPRTAILQRLDWAGLPDSEVPFAMIPSYETFHFTKPNPAYFAEFLAQLGWPKIPIIMVGNDVESDIGGARSLGLPVFWMTDDGSQAWNGTGDIPPHGGFPDLIPWLDSSTIEPLPTSFTSPEALLAILRSTPAALATLCHTHNTHLHTRPAPGEWSPGEVLCHLRDVDSEVNLVRLLQVLHEANPFLPGQDTDPWAEARQYFKQDGSQALLDFINARLVILDLLEKMTLEDWERRARHAIFGPTNLRELVNIMAGHDILHVQQVFRAL
jgi:FMN phosphatase YigB (HAD superfamily)